MPKCLLFDCDGTLVDSERLNCKAMSIELSHEGIEESAASLFQRYKGFNFYSVLEDLGQRHATELGESFTERFRERAEQQFTSHLRPVAGVYEALESLPHPRCVVSNAPLKKIVHELTVTDLLHFFDNRLYSAYQVGHWKPDPHLLLHAADQQQVAVADCVVIEDSRVGVEAAANAGMSVVLYDPDGLEKNLQATVTINDMADLPDAIAQV